MKRADMVRHGTKELIEAENAVELALAKVAGFINTVTTMRLNSNLSMTVGQGAVSALVATTSKLAEARAAMLEAHSEFKDIRDQLGCKDLIVDVGHTEKPEEGSKPPVVPFTAKVRSAA